MNLKKLFGALLVTAAVLSCGCAHRNCCRPAATTAGRPCCPDPCYNPPPLAVPAAPVPITSGFAPAAVPGCCR